MHTQHLTSITGYMQTVSFNLFSGCCRPFAKKLCFTLLLSAGSFRVTQSASQTSQQDGPIGGCQWLQVREEKRTVPSALREVRCSLAIAEAWLQINVIPVLPLGPPSYRVKSRVFWPALGCQLGLYCLFKQTSHPGCLAGYKAACASLQSPALVQALQ